MKRILLLITTLLTTTSFAGSPCNDKGCKEHQQVIAKFPTLPKELDIFTNLAAPGCNGLWNLCLEKVQIRVGPVHNASPVEANEVASAGGYWTRWHFATIGGNLFLSNFNVSLRGQENKGPKPTTQRMAEIQPWFRWDEASQSFKFELTGAGSAIWKNISPEKGSITLYRGTSTREVNYAKGIISLPKNQRRAELDKSYDPQRGYGGFYFTPNDVVADEQFSNDMVVKVTVTRKDLESLIAANKIYLGTENGYVELAFSDPEVILYFFEKYEVCKFIPGDENERMARPKGSFGGCDQPPKGP